mmetsp:Transcript_37984/g.74390  ORF Transcript_37984/g.74390 Transcript_37984/m.74390 type:complete len:114 (+) Transcript_37984:554-895(+)
MAKFYMFLSYEQHLQQAYCLGTAASLPPTESKRPQELFFLLSNADRVLRTFVVRRRTVDTSDIWVPKNAAAAIAVICIPSATVVFVTGDTRPSARGRPRRRTVRLARYTPPLL